MINTEDSDDGKRVHDPYGDEPPTAGLEERIVGSLRDKHLIAGRTIGTRTRILYGVTAACVIVVAFFSGMYYSSPVTQRTASKGDNTMSATNRQYLLLVYDSPGFEEGDGHAKEYGEWFHTYGKDGLLTGGEELAEGGYTLKVDVNKVINYASNVVSGNEGHVSGYFLISAPTDEKAKEIAATCPHLKYNGTLELRPLKY